MNEEDLQQRDTISLKGSILYTLRCCYALVKNALPPCSCDRMNSYVLISAIKSGPSAKELLPW